MQDCCLRLGPGSGGGNAPPAPLLPPPVRVRVTAKHAPAPPQSFTISTHEQIAGARRSSSTTTTTTTTTTSKNSSCLLRKARNKIASVTVGGTEGDKASSTGAAATSATTARRSASPGPAAPIRHPSGRRLSAAGGEAREPHAPISSAAAVLSASTATTAGPPSLLPQPRPQGAAAASGDAHGLLAACAVTELPCTSPADRHLAASQRARSPASAMALKFLGSHHGGSSATSSAVKHFDIRLDNDYIVFRGTEDAAASAHLAGSVVLCLTEPMHVSHIQLTLSGIAHLSWPSTTAHMSGRRVSLKEKTFFEKTWSFMVASKSKTEVLQPDNYEWPFDTILEGHLPESIEGLKDAWVIYRLKAEIGRKRARDIVARKPLRIVRTLDPSALELAHAMSVDNIWPNKIEYSISVPSKAIVFGSFVRVNFKLISLLKGLVIGAVTTEVREEQELVVDPEWGASSLAGAQAKTERVIAHDVYTVDPDRDEQVLDEVAEGYQFSRFLELPKTLNECLQDCNAKGIKVRHKVKFNVQLHNPDGHVSELRANLPIMLYISPNHPINENNDLVDQSPQAGRAAMEIDMAHAAPPVYGEHLLDKLYSELDPSGYLTPGMALSSPGTPYLQSRQQSHENLRSLNAVASGGSRSASSSAATSFVSPAALQHRLQNLHVGFQSRLAAADDADTLADDASSERRSDPHTPAEDVPSPGAASPHTSVADAAAAAAAAAQSRSNSSSLSRRVSEEVDGYASGARTPFPQYAHMEDLTRVPSYTTAVKSTPFRRLDEDASSARLPTYGAATLAPTSAPPAEPQMAHVRATSRSPLAPDTPAQVRAPSQGGDAARLLTHHGSGLLDDEQRLRLLQARGR